MQKTYRALLVIAVFFLSCSALWAGEPAFDHAKAQQMDQEVREQILAQVADRVVYAPFLPSGDTTAKLLVVNRVWYAIEVDVVLSVGRKEVPLGRHTIANRSFLDLPLGDVLAELGGLADRAVLQVRYVGDDTTLQSWLVVERDQQVERAAGAGVGAPDHRASLRRLADRVGRGER